MRRRQFIALAGLAAALPLAAQAQQGEGARRVGVLLPATKDDSEYPSLFAAFAQGLQQRGWTDGRNLRIDVRWAGGGIEMNRKLAAELVGLGPDVILAAGASSTGPLLQVTRTIPVVFTIVPDPVGAGFVDNLARPGGNVTGLTSFDYGIGGKWLELLKEIAPQVKRVAVLRDSATTAGVGQWSAIQTAAPAFGIEVSPVNLKDPAEFERAVAAYARAGNAGMIVTSSGVGILHRNAILRLAAKNKLPALYYSSAFVTGGGLISYGSDRVDQFRKAAEYVDRILRGAKPGEIPVQTPTKYELVVSKKAAASLGLSVPNSLLLRADRVVD